MVRFHHHWSAYGALCEQEPSPGFVEAGPKSLSSVLEVEIKQGNPLAAEKSL